jgi:hypothetical protein
MWICHTATPRALLAMPATCKDVAAATRASGKARDPQRCCRSNDGRRESAKPLGAMRALGGARRRFERNAQMPTENDRQTWPDTASPRCIAAVRVDRRTGRYRRLRAGARSRAAPQKRKCAPPPRRERRRYWCDRRRESVAGGRRGQVGNAVVPSARVANLQSRVVDCDHACGGRQRRASGSGDEGSHTRSVSLTRSAFLRSLGSSSFLRSRIAFGVTSTNSSSVI